MTNLQNHYSGYAMDEWLHSHFHSDVITYPYPMPSASLTILLAKEVWKAWVNSYLPVGMITCPFPNSR